MHSNNPIEFDLQVDLIWPHLFQFGHKFHQVKIFDPYNTLLACDD
jgi:hypothetical protein